jgi:hypothetical protein
MQYCFSLCDLSKVKKISSSDVVVARESVSYNSQLMRVFPREVYKKGRTGTNMARSLQGSYYHGEDEEAEDSADKKENCDDVDGEERGNEETTLDAVADEIADRKRLSTNYRKQQFVWFYMFRKDGLG